MTAITREPGTFVLNYPGDVTADMHPGQQLNAARQRLQSNLYGTLLRESFGYPLEVRDSTYDAGADSTRVVLVPATLPRSGSAS